MPLVVGPDSRNIANTSAIIPGGTTICDPSAGSCVPQDQMRYLIWPLLRWYMGTHALEDFKVKTKLADILALLRPPCGMNPTGVWQPPGTWMYWPPGMFDVFRVPFNIAELKSTGKTSYTRQYVPDHYQRVYTHWQVVFESMRPLAKMFGFPATLAFAFGGQDPTIGWQPYPDNNHHVDDDVRMWRQTLTMRKLLSREFGMAQFGSQVFTSLPGFSFNAADPTPDEMDQPGGAFAYFSRGGFALLGGLCTGSIPYNVGSIYGCLGACHMSAVNQGDFQGSVNTFTGDACLAPINMNDGIDHWQARSICLDVDGNGNPQPWLLIVEPIQQSDWTKVVNAIGNFMSGMFSWLCSSDGQNAGRALTGALQQSAATLSKKGSKADPSDVAAYKQAVTALSIWAAQVQLECAACGQACLWSEPNMIPPEDLPGVPAPTGVVNFPQLDEEQQNWNLPQTASPLASGVPTIAIGIAIGIAVIWWLNRK